MPNAKPRLIRPCGVSVYTKLPLLKQSANILHTFMFQGTSLPTPRLKAVFHLAEFCARSNMVENGLNALFTQPKVATKKKLGATC